MYCTNCGAKIEQTMKYCVQCGQRTPFETTQSNQSYNDDPFSKYDTNPYPQSQTVNPPKSRIVAGILGIVVGGLGIHNFYLGYIEKGIAQILLSTIGIIVLFGPMVAGIWGLIEGIMILTKHINVDGNGNPLSE